MKIDSKGFITVKEINGIPLVVSPIPTNTVEYKSVKTTNKKYIVIHNAGSKADDTTLNKYMSQDDYKIWHFTVDKDSITQGHSIYLSGYHTGDGENGAGNLYGIGIEIADKGDDSECEASARNAFKLIKFLQDESPFGPLTLKPHQFFSPNKKYCPKWILDNWGWQGFLDRYSLFRKENADEVIPHWAEKHYQSLNKKGIVIHERRFDDKITRGEVMALLDKMYKG